MTRPALTMSALASRGSSSEPARARGVREFTQSDRANCVWSFLSSARKAAQEGQELLFFAHIVLFELPVSDSVHVYSGVHINLT